MKKRKSLAFYLLLGSLVATTGLVLSSCQGNEIQEEDPGDNPGENPGENPGGEPGENPGEDPTPTPDPEEKAYKVSFTANEEVEMKTDKSEYKKGEIVTITLNIKNVDKTVGLVEVSSKAQVTVVEIDKTYTFVMSEEDVTVTVTLKDREYGQKALTVNEVEGFSVKFFVNEQQVTSAKKYDVVTVKLEVTSVTKRFKSLTSAGISLEEVKKGEEYRFTMVDNEVNFVLEVEDIPSRTLSAPSGEGFSAVFKVGDDVVTTALEGTSVTLEITLEEDYFFVGINWTGVALEDVTEVQKGVEYSFVVGLENIVATIDVDPVPTYDIKINAIDGFTTSFKVDGVEIQKAKEGEEITLSITYDKEIYRLDSKEVSAKFGEDIVTLIEKKDSVEGAKLFTFVMPAGQVDIEFKGESIPSHSLSLVGENITDSYFQVDGEEVTSAKEGEEVTLYMKYDDDNYIFKDISAEGADLIEQYRGDGAARFTFIMGTSEVVVTALIERIPDYNLTYSEVNGADISFLVNGKEGAGTAREGDEVIVVISIEKGYELAKFSINDDAIKYEPAPNGPNSYKFVMPAEDANVYVEVAQKEKYEIVSIVPSSTSISDISIKQGTSYFVDEQVEFTFSYSGDDDVIENFDVSVNGEFYDATYESTDPNYSWEKTYSVSFKMPEDDAEIIISEDLPEVTDGTGFTFNANEDENFKILGVSNGAQYSKDNFVFTIVPDEGYKVSSFTYVIDGDTANPNTLELDGKYNVNMSKWGSSWYPENLLESVTSYLDVTIETEYVGSYDVVLGNEFGVKMEGRSKKILTGNEVELTPVALDGYRLPDTVAATISYIDENGEQVEQRITENYREPGKVTFEMPRSNVIINFEIEECYGLSVEENEFVSVKLTNSSSVPGEYTDSLTEAVEDELIWIHAKPVEGYIVAGIEVVDHPEVSVTAYGETSGYYQFRMDMPAHEVKLRVIVEKIYTLTYDTEKLYVSLKQDGSSVDLNEIVAGEEYTLEIEALRGYEITDKPRLVYLEDGVEKEVSLTESEVSGEYSFVAPAYDIELKVETLDLPKHKVSFDFYSISGFKYKSYLNLKNEDGDYVDSGDEVIEGETLSVNTYYSLNDSSNWDLGYVYEGIYLVYNDGDKEVEEKVEGTSFVVPAYDFEIQIRAIELEKNTIEFDLPDGVSTSVEICETNSSYSGDWDYADEDYYTGSYEVINGYYAKVTLTSDEADSFKLLDLSTLKVLSGETEVEITMNNNGENNVEEVEIVFQVSGDTTISLGELYQAPSASFEFDTTSLPDGINSSDLETRLTDYENGEEIYSYDRVAVGTEVYIVYSPDDQLTDYTNYEFQLWSSDGTRLLGTYELVDGSTIDYRDYYYYYYYCVIEAPAEDVLVKIVYNGSVVA